MSATLNKNIVLLARYISRFGLVKGPFSYLWLRLSSFGKFNTIGLLKHKFYLRRGTSDREVFEQIFIDRQYEFKLGFVPKMIIDCGANIGLSAIYFANKFPDAKIIAIEAELSNFEMLKMNCSHYPNIICLHNAVWHKEETLTIEDPGKGHFSFKTTNTRTGHQKVETVTLQSLMTRYNIDSIDLLKIDIEGAEYELFSINYDEWLSKTTVIVVEVHDWFRGGTSAVLIKALARYNFGIGAQGEGFVCARV